ncbi:ATP-binding protein [Shimia ponticola]|uniref:ATP-binding protein n=1 Tax=Shimia ponticola TaxID=2582893 RepID=UPI00210518BE|nr:ATP-binding protein [Shimia ponticola]
MAQTLNRQSGLFRLTRRLEPQATVVLIAASMVAVASLFMDADFPALVILVMAVSLGTLAFSVKVVRAWYSMRQRSVVRSVACLIENDASASFLTDNAGNILMRNRAADDRVTMDDSDQLANCLADLFANPGPILAKLQSKALALGAARDDIITRRGHVRVAVTALARDSYLWRVEDIVDRVSGDTGAQTLSLPMMTVSSSGAVLFMNTAMRTLVGERVKSLDRMFSNLPVRNGQLNEVRTTTGKIGCLVADVEGSAGRREIFLLPGSVPDTEFAKDGWSFFDEVPVALLKFSPSGEVLASNRMARELIGQSVRTGTEISEIFDSLGRSVTDWVREAADGRNLGHAEFLQVLNRDDDTFVQVTFNRVKENDEIVLIAVLNDATELKSLEKQFVQSQKMQAIGQLAGGVAHDFNNLLTAISGHCDLLLLRHDATDQDYSDLMQINQNANRAAALVGQLLAFSRKQNLQPEVLDVRDVLSDMGHLLNRLMGETVTMSQTHSGELPAIRADKRQLEQVLMNLVVNAKDAMPDGGKIRLITEHACLTDAKRMGRAIVPAGDYVVVKVRDQGIGIPPDKLPKIFEPFFTTKGTGKGTGLGLSTAYGIVKQTGGFIFVDSVVDHGTTFTLYFPVHEGDEGTDPIASKARAHAEASSKTGDGVVLLVEDEAPVRAFASRALRLRGFTVLEADSAESALRTLADTELDVDIFVTDVVMPGQDGPSWVREALKEHPDTQVIFVSGYAQEVLADRQTKIPNSRFLAKPFSLNELTTVVQEALH